MEAVEARPRVVGRGVADLHRAAVDWLNEVDRAASLTPVISRERVAASLCTVRSLQPIRDAIRAAGQPRRSR